jgi:Domain of unknown function (DUF1707)
MLASDADRDRVLQALQEAYVQGRLNHDELDQRIDTALRSRTTEELHSLLDDLRPRPAPPAVPPAAPPGQWQRQGFAPYVNWWPGLLIGVVVLGLVAGSHNGQYMLWWLVFPAFFWFRGGRRRYRDRYRR